MWQQQDSSVMGWQGAARESCRIHHKLPQGESKLPLTLGALHVQGEAVLRDTRTLSQGNLLVNPLSTLPSSILEYFSVFQTYLEYSPVKRNC